MSKQKQVNINSFTEDEMDQIISEVEQLLSKAESLSKSKKAAPEERMDEPPMELPPEAPPEASPEAPPEEMPMESAPPVEDALPEAPPEEMPPEAPPEEMPPEAPPEEQAGEEQPLSDEELHQIYGTMPPEELERHYMVIRQHMQALYQQQDQAAPPEAPPSEEPLAASEKDVSELDSLKLENEALKKEHESIKKSIDLMTKAIELSFQPQRKSIEGLEFVKKSAAEEISSKPLSKSELTDKISSLYGDQSKVSTLSKTDREAVSNFLLYGTDRETVEKILNLGGK